MQKSSFIDGLQRDKLAVA